MANHIGGGVNGVEGVCARDVELAVGEDGDSAAGIPEMQHTRVKLCAPRRPCGAAAAAALRIDRQLFRVIRSGASMGPRLAVKARLVVDVACIHCKLAEIDGATQELSRRDNVSASAKSG